MEEPGHSPTASQYDKFADVYADGGPYNALYERPAMLELLGDVSGLSILDVGCGSGVLTQLLNDKGASVIGLDGSEAMLKLARARLGSKVELRHHDLQQSLTWLPDESLDRIVASLVMHYLKDWERVLREFRRVLKPSGRFVFSTHHPFADFVNFTRPDYFAIEEILDEWGASDASYQVRFWRRPLSVIVRDLVNAGFVIEELAEPRPASLDQLDDRHKQRLMTQPWFLFVAARTAK
ncbi:MAG: class I SAM-dependent methyltransferase [Actinomycetota bacterium]|nr:class I SAM-dependent methyltransferase [Actinomycetota bacterium]